ncbi:MAG: dihydrofolate reductase family protein [Reyranella sp.]|uniref:dihydrofolate reductase family protein n=1 Tax=Reyranella sp. TaxID=1929291 RepID=UPI001ACFAE36|nr:dihydrofolate reductase family protein [Reyranella sp.]MBN9541027.1 dihydrofolate reductase family protein [Alphaproteobacteria bacterium]MBR2817490.1 dihydrofolate reductase family protein [Reyranella sp.]
MKPYVLCHMVCSVDGRIWGSRWRPKENVVPNLFEKLHDQLGGGSWLCGRVTAQEFAKGTEPHYPPTDQVFPRENWFARRDAKTWGIFLDGKGKAVWARKDIGGDAVLVVLTEAVPDRHLAGLRADGVSYIFAGATEIDLAGALETLNRELGIERIMLEGGGGANGALLRAGLIDELSLVICPVIDGSTGGPIVFNSGDADLGPAPIESMTLASHEVLEGGAMWLRYRLSAKAA